MVNVKNDRTRIDGVQLRTQSRQRASSLLAAGVTVNDICAQLKCGKNTIYKWMKEPAFIKQYDEERELLAIGAVSQTAVIIESAIETIQKGINAGDAKLAMDFLKETGVLRTTGAKIGMDQKLSGESGGGVSVIINVSSDQFDKANNTPIIDVECVVSDHNDDNNEHNE